MALNIKSIATWFGKQGEQELRRGDWIVYRHYCGSRKFVVKGVITGGTYIAKQDRFIWDVTPVEEMDWRGQWATHGFNVSHRVENDDVLQYWRVS